MDDAAKKKLLDELEQEIASSFSSASYRDRSVTKRSLDELLRAYAALSGGSFPHKAYLSETSKGIGSSGGGTEGGQ